MSTPTADLAARALMGHVRVGDIVTVRVTADDVYHLTVERVIAKGQAAVTIVATNPDAPVMQGNVRSRRYWASTHRRATPVAKAYGRGVAVYPAN
jgi:hypothetical protein